MESSFGLSLRSNKEGQKLHMSSRGKTSQNSTMLGHLSQGASEPKASLVFTGKVISCPLHSSLLLEEGQTSRPLFTGYQFAFCILPLVWNQMVSGRQLPIHAVETVACVRQWPYSQQRTTESAWGSSNQLVLDNATLFHRDHHLPLFLKTKKGTAGIFEATGLPTALTGE